MLFVVPSPIFLILVARPPTRQGPLLHHLRTQWKKSVGPRLRGQAEEGRLRLCRPGRGSTAAAADDGNDDSGRLRMTMRLAEGDGEGRGCHLGAAAVTGSGW